MVLSDVKDRLNTRLREGPGTRIKRLLLAPHDRLSIRVAIEVLLNLLPREGVELLDTRDGGIGDALVEAVLVQRGVDLAGTEDHALDLLGRDGGATVLGLGDDGAELGVADELVDGGAGERVAEEGLGEEDDESWGGLVRCGWLRWLGGGGDLRFLNCLFICLRRMWNKLDGEVM